MHVYLAYPPRAKPHEAFELRWQTAYFNIPENRRMEGEMPCNSSSVGVVMAQRKGEENTCLAFLEFKRLHGDASAVFLAARSCYPGAIILAGLAILFLLCFLYRSIYSPSKQVLLYGREMLLYFFSLTKG